MDCHNERRSGLGPAPLAPTNDNAAIAAALKANPGKRHIVTASVEHSSVLNYCIALEKGGYRATYLPVDRDGLLKLAWTRPR